MVLAHHDVMGIVCEIQPIDCGHILATPSSRLHELWVTIDASKYTPIFEGQPLDLSLADRPQATLFFLPVHDALGSWWDGANGMLPHPCHIISLPSPHELLVTMDGIASASTYIPMFEGQPSDLS